MDKHGEYGAICPGRYIVTLERFRVPILKKNFFQKFLTVGAVSNMAAIALHFAMVQLRQSSQQPESLQRQLGSGACGSRLDAARALEMIGFLNLWYVFCNAVFVYFQIADHLSDVAKFDIIVLWQGGKNFPIILYNAIVGSHAQSKT